jgi:prepilin-type N-terminal cleavage/methylation domain-containing protein
MLKHHHLPKNRFRAFTLIEMLVVVAIIGILSALLLPVAGNMRKSGQVTKSMNNLKQIQLANIQYAADNNMNYVEGQAGNGDIWMWNAEFYRYLGFDRTKFAWNKFPEVFYSPLADRSKVNYSYGYNVTRFAANNITTRNSLRVSPASQMMAFVESQDWQVRKNEANNYDGTERYRALTTAYRAGGRGGAAKTLAAFYDGHVEAVSRDSIVNNDTFWGTGYQ